MGPIWDIYRDLRSAQLREGLGIQNKQESTFLLETDTEEEDYVIGRGEKRSQISLLAIMILRAPKHLSSPMHSKNTCLLRLQ